MHAIVYTAHLAAFKPAASARSISRRGLQQDPRKQTSFITYKEHCAQCAVCRPATVSVLRVCVGGVRTHQCAVRGVPAGERACSSDRGSDITDVKPSVRPRTMWVCLPHPMVGWTFSGVTRFKRETIRMPELSGTVLKKQPNSSQEQPEFAALSVDLEPFNRCTPSCTTKYIVRYAVSAKVLRSSASWSC
jgi:hypothetical protein